MADTTKHRRKRSEPERINLDEWGNAGALEGLLSFLNIAPEHAPVNQGANKVLDLLERRHRPSPAESQTITDREPVIEPALSEEPVSATAESARETTASPATGEPCPIPDTLSVIEETGAPPITDPLPVLDPEWSHPKQGTGFGNKKLYRCTLAQHGHSHTEEALYQLLWKSGTPEGDDETRLTVMGYGEMSKRVRLSFNNTKYACQRLIAKLAIEEVAREVSDLRQGKTYRIFSYRSILERRKAAGLEWVIRNKGVEFVTPVVTAPPVTDRVPDIDTVSISGRGTVSISGRGTLSITGTLLENSLENTSREYKQSPSSSTELPLLLRALADYGHPDDDVARQLLTRCRTAAPDCSTEDIVHFVHQKGALLRQDRSGRIANPLGFLLTAVPKCFSGETFDRYREQLRQSREFQRLEHEQQSRELEQWRREHQAVLEDPAASEEDKRFARQVLGMA